METLDWLVVAGYCLLVVGIGFVQKKRAERGTDDFFLTGRKLSWWVAGTGMAATAWASDTPLLVTGFVRNHGIWKNWEWWSLAVSSMLAVFFFSRLWRRAKVVTEVELVELRYSGKPAAFLRGFKAIYWGVLFNCYVAGAWPVNGLAKVMGTAVGWPKMNSVLFCVGVGTVYSVASGMWGIAVADMVEMVFMIGGALIVMGFALDRVGGLDALVTALQTDHSDKLAMFPSYSSDAMHSPFWWAMGMLAIQWWAYKNTDGGGMIVQKMSACKDEKNAVYATLLFNIVHNALRVWPWIIVALASLVLIPPGHPSLIAPGATEPDAELAYPLLFKMLLKPGLFGLVIASFFAAFMSTVSAHTNWGASYVVNDFYRRFVRPKESEDHYVFASRLTSVLLMGGTILSAYFTASIGDAFSYVLKFTAGVGVVYLLRWFWWRINPWSEIAAMLASVPAMLVVSTVASAVGLSTKDAIYPIFQLVFMVAATTLVWLPVTLLTAPVSRERLEDFYRRVQPPGPGWGPVRESVGRASQEPLGQLVLLWVVGVAFIYAATFGIGQLLIGNRPLGAGLVGGAIVALAFLVRRVQSLPTPAAALELRDDNARTHTSTS